MGYRCIPPTGFEFETDSLSYGTIERIICRHYDLGCVNTSNFMAIEEGSSSGHFISATRGMIEFGIVVSKMKSGKYWVYCSPSSVKVER